MIGRIPGVALGTIIVKTVSPTVLAYAGAGLVLFAVGVTAFTRPIPHNTATLTASPVSSAACSARPPGSADRLSR